MTRSELTKYIKKTENMVSPGRVGGLFLLAEVFGRLPAKFQKFIVEKGSAKDPYISFIVEPYSFFPAYEITDVEQANKYLPPDYELIPCAMFDGTTQRYCAILGIFNVHTSVFWGNRVEFYLIAENKKTGLMSWIICAYESNTISYDPGRGLLGPTTKHAVVTTSYAGDLIVDIAGRKSGNEIALVANILSGKLAPLNQRLWVEGNLSVDYGGDLEDEGSVPFGLIFDPKEMEKALHIPLDEVIIEHNSFGKDVLAPLPFEICCFPFAQHFVTTVYPLQTSIINEDDLENAIKELNIKLP